MSNIIIRTYDKNHGTNKPFLRGFLIGLHGNSSEAPIIYDVTLSTRNAENIEHGSKIICALVQNKLITRAELKEIKNDLMKRVHDDKESKIESRMQQIKNLIKIFRVQFEGHIMLEFIIFVLIVICWGMMLF